MRLQSLNGRAASASEVGFPSPVNWKRSMCPHDHVVSWPRVPMGSSAVTSAEPVAGSDHSQMLVTGL